VVICLDLSCSVSSRSSQFRLYCVLSLFGQLRSPTRDVWQKVVGNVPVNGGAKTSQREPLRHTKRFTKLEHSHLSMSLRFGSSVPLCL